MAVLNNLDVEAKIKCGALKTLNDMASHQEVKDQMIDADVIEAIAPLLHDKHADVRREAVSLVGSFANSQRGRSKFGILYKGIQGQLTDDSPSVQEVCAWAISRLSSTREGCEMISACKLATSMVVAFIRYTTPMFFKKELHEFFLYLLEAFINITEYDNGIIPTLGTGTIAALRDILLPEYKNDFGIFKQRIHESYDF